MHHTITPVAFIELLMSFTLCVFDINETDDNVDNIAVFRMANRKRWMKKINKTKFKLVVESQSHISYPRFYRQ